MELTEKEKKSACARAWYVRNREKQVAYSRKWRAENPDKHRLYKQEWNKRNPDKVKQMQKRFREKDPERFKSSVDASKAKKPEHYKLNLAKWKRANPYKVKALWNKRRLAKNESLDNFTADEWQTLKDAYDNTCLCCLKQEPDVQLTADHVVPVSKGGTNGIGNIQPLCKDCNCRKYTKETDYRPSAGGLQSARTITRKSAYILPP
jgi:5-methylcytosine-specific restriction endonuclease McrA